MENPVIKVVHKALIGILPWIWIEPDSFDPEWHEHYTEPEEPAQSMQTSSVQSSKKRASPTESGGETTSPAS